MLNLKIRGICPPEALADHGGNLVVIPALLVDLEIPEMEGVLIEEVCSVVELSDEIDVENLNEVATELLNKFQSLLDDDESESNDVFDYFAFIEVLQN